jgi:hypothetical protein
MKHRCGTVALVLLGLAGCAQPQTRLQAEEEAERDPFAEVKTIGDVTSVANAEPINVSGVGLVVGLNGTGGTPPGSFRSALEAELRRQRVDHIKELIDSPDSALVLVSAQIPPGTHKDDPVDVDVTLPPQSKATSLRGGVLKACTLYNYESTRNLSQDAHVPDQLIQGHPLAKAEGTLLVGFGDGDESASPKHARIWGGGHSQIERPFYVVLNGDKQSARLAAQIAQRVNETFQGPYRGPGGDLAKAENKNFVYLRVPVQYKLNLPRYLRVVRLIPLQEAPIVHGRYLKKLEEELLDPARTITAALRLEALGTGTVPILKKGLDSEHSLVRFAAAESLAYLGSPSCGVELARLTQDQPMLRAFCLTALASLDEAVCHIKLQELLASNSAETRYGAFRALRALDERDRVVQGELLNDSFWVHRVAPDSEPLVHISTSRRAEIVVFGDGAALEPPFSFLAGPEFTITASVGDERCTVSRFSPEHGTGRTQCSLKMVDVLHALAELGGEYPDAIDLLRQAEKCQCMTCPVRVDALPVATSVYDLARAGQAQKKGQADDVLRSDAEVMSARVDFGATPTLFDDGVHRRSRHGDDEGSAGGQ